MEPTLQDLTELHGHSAIVWETMSEFENQILSEIIWRRKYQSTEWKVNNDVRCSTNLYWMEYIQGCSMGKEV